MLEGRMMTKGKNYEITAKNFLGHEWCGLKVRVIESSDLARKGIEGTVVDETQNTLVLSVKEKDVIIPKKECVFEFDLGKEKIVVKGIDVLKKPESRVKELN